METIAIISCCMTGVVYFVGQLAVAQLFQNSQTTRYIVSSQVKLTSHVPIGNVVSFGGLSANPRLS
jgi:amino acid transporter